MSTKYAKRYRRSIAVFFLALLCMTILPFAAFAAERGLTHDRNGGRYDYVIGYCYSGYQGGINRRQIMTAPDNYTTITCPVCGDGGYGTVLAENQYTPCYAYDVPATGGDMWIRYASIRHRHNNGQLSDMRVYIPINVAQYSGCYYSYDTTAPGGVKATAPTGWQKSSATVRFSGGSDTGTSLPDWTATPGDYGSGINHYEYRIDGGGWIGCPVNDPTLTITKGGETTVTARVVDGAGNASADTATVKVYVDTVAPNAPTVSASNTVWTNQNVTVSAKDNGDTYSGVNRVETSLNGGAWARYGSAITLSAHGTHTVSARVFDNVERVSGTASATVRIDKIAPVISGVTQTPNAGRTEMMLAIAATDADSGVKGYAVTSANTAPASSAFSTAQPKVNKNGTYYGWAIDNAGNISAGKQITVTALDIVPPVVTKVETQRTWDAAQNWAKVTASDDNSGVVKIGWAASKTGAVTWVNANATATFSYTNNTTYYAFAQDFAGNVSAPVAFTIDRIDKNSPVIDAVNWDKNWTQSKTITVSAHDTGSGMGQYAMTKTTAQPTAWQNSNVFAGITQNGKYYLWAKDNVQRVSTSPTTITVDTIDRSKPVMDDIIHSSKDNAPAGKFARPYFNVVDRPAMTAHDEPDPGSKGSGIKEIQYRFLGDTTADPPTAQWLTYSETDKPAMRTEFTGKVIGRAVDNAGNVSDPLDAAFLFEQTPPTAADTKTPNFWTNGNVKIAVNTTDNLSGVYNITMPDGNVVETSKTSLSVAKNGIYTFVVKDYCGNILTYPVDVSNIDLIKPTAGYTLKPADWTNDKVTIQVKATDPKPADGYAPSGVKSITLPDGKVVTGDAADFVVDKNGKFDFVITDNAGNTFTLNTEVSNIDLVKPAATYTLKPDVWTNGKVTIQVKATDPKPTDGYAPSGVKSITLPDGKVVAGDAADFVVEKNGKFDFVITDNAGNTFTLNTEVANIDLVKPAASYALKPDVWTNGKVTIQVKATDPKPADGYAPSGVKSITLPDGKVVAGDAADFVVEKNGKFDFIITDNAGNVFKLNTEVANIDLVKPVVDWRFVPVDENGKGIITAYGETEYYNYNIRMDASATDDASGIDRYEYKVNDGAWNAFDPAKQPVFTQEQISNISVRVWDIAGNVSDEKARDFVLDKTPPVASHTLTPSGKKVRINVSADSSISGAGSIVMPDGKVRYAVDSGEYEVAKNGDYDFFFTDRCGNPTRYTVPVSIVAKPQKPIPEPQPKPQPPSEPEQKDDFPALVLPTPEPEAAPLPRLTLLDLLCTLLCGVLAVFVWFKRKPDDDDESETKTNFDESITADDCENEETSEPQRFTLQKVLATLVTIAAVVLFFLTQPLVWRFRFLDWWTILFVLLAGCALAILLSVHKKDFEEEEELDNEQEDFE